jgi:hypothetical protein
MKVHLFYTILVSFAATVVVTLLGIVGLVHVESGYLQILVPAFLLALAGAVIALFRRSDFFTDDQSEQPNAIDNLRKEHLESDAHNQQVIQSLTESNAQKEAEAAKLRETIAQLRQAPPKLPLELADILRASDPKPEDAKTKWRIDARSN